MATYAHELVSSRFASVEEYAAKSMDKANSYMENLENILVSLNIPETNNIENIVFDPIQPIDYAALPVFEELFDKFFLFNNLKIPDSPTMESIPAISSTGMPSKNFNFISNIPSAPKVSFRQVPTAPSLGSIDLPPAPDLKIPAVPTITDITLPSPPLITLPKFDAIAPDIEVPDLPTEFSFTDDPYNSDIRVLLFKKILNDIANGGTGLDVTVEEELYNRFLTRQQIENDRLYQEVQDQFSASGFSLPTGAFAHRMMQISNDISQKNDQANREIMINQAELAQKNTMFTIEQAGALEKMLVDFFNSQQERALKAKEILATNAIQIYNSIVSMYGLRFEQYKTEAQVFESKIRAELAAIEIYRAEIEGVKATTDVQQARVNLYNAQLGAVEILQKVYQVEMESTKIKAQLQNLQIDIFKSQTEAYSKSIEAEKTKVDIYATEVSAEGIRSDAFKNEVQAYEAEVKAKLSIVEVEKIVAESKLAENNLKIDLYKAELEKYNAEINTELKAADLLVKGYQIKTSTFQAQTNAKEMEFKTRMSEATTKIENLKANLNKTIALVENATKGYVALKELQTKGTEGIMNVNAQLAASAMNAVNASASESFGSTLSTSHNYTY